MWVVVGLGNPGRRYVRTRHNVGFRVVDRVAAGWGVDVARVAHGALVGEARRAGERIFLVKPQTYMNASGETVASLRRFFRFEPSHVVVAHDDVDLAVGRIRVRTAGRAGGNRGVASLIEALGSPDFVRVKVGVGRPPAGPVPVDWVLGVPPPDEAERLADAEGRAAEAVGLIVTEGAAHAMNCINQREASHGGSPL